MILLRLITHFIKLLTRYRTMDHIIFTMYYLRKYKWSFITVVALIFFVITFNVVNVILIHTFILIKFAFVASQYLLYTKLSG